MLQASVLAGKSPSRHLSAKANSACACSFVIPDIAPAKHFGSPRAFPNGDKDMRAQRSMRAAVARPVQKKSQ
jgi:hypothetical protein